MAVESKLNLSVVHAVRFVRTPTLSDFLSSQPFVQLVHFLRTDGRPSIETGLSASNCGKYGRVGHQ